MSVFYMWIEGSWEWAGSVIPTSNSKSRSWVRAGGSQSGTKLGRTKGKPGEAGAQPDPGQRQ